MHEISFRQKARYWFDRLMARGPVSQILALFIATIFLILFISAVVVVLQVNVPDLEGVNFIEIFWMSLMRSLDPGTMGGDTGWGFRIAMLVVTLGGLLIVSSLIGVLTTGIDGLLEDLRKGRSVVAETNHTVILGWSPQIFAILSELIIANQNQKSSAIAILANRDKVQMEDEIQAKIPSPGKTRIVCRSGNPIVPSDIEIVNPKSAKSIIILAPENINNDAQVIKTVLALTNNPDRKTGKYHIVAEFRESQNLQVAQLVGNGEVSLILTDDLISRIAAQASRQSGLSTVYTELLDFSGDEIYFHKEPTLVNTTFGESLLRFEDSTIIGISRPETGILLNPDKNEIIRAQDQLIAISEDDDTIVMTHNGQVDIDIPDLPNAPLDEVKTEQILLLGWNRRGNRIICEIDKYVQPGSGIEIYANLDNVQTGVECTKADLQNLQVTFNPADTTNRTFLEALDYSEITNVIVLSYSDSLSTDDADACTLVTLLHLRDIADMNHYDFSIVSEMLDIQNRDLANIARADDFIVSDKLVSLLLSQISENRLLKHVFDSLFASTGSELYLKPAELYTNLDNETDFYTITAAAREKGEIAIGYKRSNSDRLGSSGVHVNPNKKLRLKFHPDDKIIVLAEN